MTNIAQMIEQIRSLLPHMAEGEPRFWGEWHGRPGDMVYRVTSCDAENEKLIVKFNESEVLSVWSLRGVLLDRKTFKIQDADRVRWEWLANDAAGATEGRYFLDYAKEDNAITASTNNVRIRYLRPSLNEPAFELI